MGLTIHYVVHAPRCDLTQAKAFTRTLRRHAQSMQRRGEIDELLPCTDGPAELARWATCWKILELEIDPPASTGIAVAPLEGCIFPVLLGEGCEPLWLGLCRYPATITHDGRKVATKLGSGWQLRGSCKTQYASLHGWDYFRRCHVAAIALLRFCDRLGARVRIVDEGEWWPPSPAQSRTPAMTMRQAHRWLHRFSHIHISNAWKPKALRGRVRL